LHKSGLTIELGVPSRRLWSFHTAKTLNGSFDLGQRQWLRCDAE
jgi:hypothetical protein